MKQRLVPDIVNQAEVFTLPPQMSVRDAAVLMRRHRVGAVMVVDGGRLTGILSERDVLNRVVAVGLDADSTQVAQVMTASPTTLPPNATAGEALELMKARGFRHLPVVDHGRLVAMVSIRDLFAAVQEELEEDLRQRDELMFGGYGVALQ